MPGPGELTRRSSLTDKLGAAIDNSNPLPVSVVSVGVSSEVGILDAGDVRIDPATEGNINALMALIGEVAASPTQNTVLDRLKDIVTALAATMSFTEAAVVNKVHGGVTVSTSAVLLAASDGSRKYLIITNNGTADLYIGFTSSVTTSGANMGTAILPGGCYSIGSVYRGNVYGIYSAIAASENVAYQIFGAGE